MSGKEDADFLERLRSLSLTGAQELLTGLDRLKQLHEEVSNIDPDQLQSNKAKQSDLVYSLAKMELEHAESLLNLGNAQASLLFEHVRNLARTARNRGEPPVQVLNFQFGTTERECQTRRFRIHNPFETDADPRFEISGLRDHQGRHHSEHLGLVTPTLEPIVAPARSTADVAVAVAPGMGSGLYFADLNVHLCADVERHVAKRVIKVKVQ